MAWRIERMRDSHAAQANFVCRRYGGASEIAASKERMRFENGDFEIVFILKRRCFVERAFENVRGYIG